MKVLIVGSGGREHAIAWKMQQSPNVSQVYVAPGNDGMRSQFEVRPAQSHQDFLSLIQQENINLTFVGPEAYLVKGLVDFLEEAGCQVVGPSAHAASLEGSKAFSKQFMERYHIPTAAHAVFEDPNKAVAYLKQQKAPYVLKTSGLAAGKGVLICNALDEAEKTVRSMLSGKAFGDAGTTVVIEEFLEGEEASFFILADGQNFVSFPACQDHKRIGELDTGLNTGGMGAYSPAPIVTETVEKKIVEQIVKPTIAGMANEGAPYKGVLYIGLMIHNETIKVVEYNCRFGDPECQPLMMLLKSDLAVLSMAVVTGTLDTQTLECYDDAAAGITLASKGYPGSYEKGKIISGLESTMPESGQTSPSSFIFHSGTQLEGTVYRTNGGRVLTVTALGETLEEALTKAYQRVENIHWEGITYRRDIGLKGLMHNQDNRPDVSVGIVIGSKSDLEIAKKATAILDKFEVGYRLCITSAHRTPERTRTFIQESEEKGVEVFIAMAGMAAHLPGVLAAETTKPVIGVPVVSTLNGLDSLLAIAQMPPGVPVATMATNGAVNAAVLATQILSLRYTDLRAKLKSYKMEMAQKVIESQESAGLEPI